MSAPDLADCTEQPLDKLSDSDLLRQAEQIEAKGWHPNHSQNLLTRALRELHGLRQAQAAQQTEARHHAVALEQCALYGADIGDSIAEAMKGAAAFLRRVPGVAGQHPDDLSVDAFASVMKAKLEKKRGRLGDGWRGADCSAERLSRMLREHVEKGDPVDVANFAMMLHQRGEQITPPVRQPGRENEREELISYILQEDLHNRLTPRLVDIGYTAWSLGRSGKNAEDGGPCDWFNDTKPTVDAMVEKIRRDLDEAEKAQAAGASQ